MESGYPKEPAAESLMQDEGGRELIRLGIGVRRDIIVEAGYKTEPGLPEAMGAAMSELTALAKDKAIMAASLIKAADIARLLPADDPETPKYAAIAELMLHECLRNYSMSYNRAREERLKKRASEKED